VATLLKDPTDILGERFGSLVIAEFLGSEPYAYGKKVRKTRRNYLYRCICDCGRTDFVTKRVLVLSGHTKSCGCQWKPKAGLNWRWTGCGELSGVLWSKIRNHARYRNLSFTITIQEAWELFLTQKGRCALTGNPIAFASSMAEENGGGRTASLDRIDSTKGYTSSNVQWVHKDINVMKMDLSESRFLELCRAVVQHQR
jgi:hypothetical protein